MPRPRHESNDRLRSVLEAARDGTNLVAYYKWAKGTDALLVGFVREVSERKVRFATIDPYGEDSGDDVVPLARIVRLTVDDDYLRGLRRCYEHPEFRNLDVGPVRSAHARDEVAAILADALNEGYPVTVTLRTDGERNDAFVRALDDSWADLEFVYDGGFSDGVLTLRIRQIAKVEAGTHGQRRVLFEYQGRRSGEPGR